MMEIQIELSPTHMIFQATAAGISSSYTAKLEVLSDHTNSPFASADYIITVEPEVRSIFSGEVP